MTVDRIASAFCLKSSAPGTYKVKCPAHNDKNPSLSVTITHDKALITCHAGCTTDAILSAVGLTTKDLFFDEKLEPRREVARYDYGKYIKVRYKPKDFRFFDKNGNPGLNGHEHVLYHLQEIAAAKVGDHAVFLSEGEKDADIIREKLQCIAVSLDCGALPANASPARLKPLDALVDVAVFIVPDQDAQGKVHGDTVAKYLYGKAKEIYLVNVTQGKDITEYFEQGGTPEAFRALCASAPMWQPEAIKPAVYTFSWADNPPEVQPLIKFKGTGVLWPEGIALLTGPQGKGKSNIVHAVAAGAINPECDSLGFNDVAKPLILIDTENPLSLFRKNVRRGIISRAGRPEGTLTEGVDYVNIRGLETFGERQDYLSGLMEAGKYRLYLIDGAGDFVLDVNHIDTAIPFVSKLCAMTLKHHCGVFVTLHGNPGIQSEKARGHLGSELLRKADCSLFLKVDGDTRSITTSFSQGKNRAGNDDLTQYFSWDDLLEMHVSCDAPVAKNKATKTRRDRQEIADLINEPMRRCDIIRLIMDHCGIKERAANDRFSDLCAAGMLEKLGNFYQKIEMQHWSA